MNAAVNELRKAGIFYIATVDDDNKPHVRPFGAVAEFEGKAYICTNNRKKCYAQMIAHPDVEITAMQGEGMWIRLSAKVIRDGRDEARAAMLDACPELKGMYAVGDGVFEVLYFEDINLVRWSFTAPPEVIV